MHIYKLHTTASGEIFALIDPRLTPPSVKRTSYNSIGPRDKGNNYTSFEDVPFRTPSETSGPPLMDKYTSAYKSQEEAPLASWVALNDLTKCKVHITKDNLAVIALANAPLGLRRSTCRNDLLTKEAQLAMAHESLAAELATGRYSGPTPEHPRWTGSQVYVAVYLNELIGAAQGKPATVAAASSGSKLPASPTTMVDGIEAKTCLERYVRIMQAEDPKKLGFTLTPKQKDAAREMWSAQLRAKVQASDAEAKRKDREQVLVELHPDDLL